MICSVKNKITLHKKNLRPTDVKIHCKFGRLYLNDAYMHHLGIVFFVADSFFYVKAILVTLLCLSRLYHPGGEPGLS